MQLPYKEKQWPPVTVFDPKDLEPVDPKELLDYYKFEIDHAKSYEAMIYETTKYNFLAFGAVFLLTSSSFLTAALDPQYVIYGACIAVGLISLSASVMALYFWKYISAVTYKARLIQQAM
jgi:hypothetical protein